MNQRTLKILITIAVAGGAAAFLLFSSISEATSYYKHVEEVVARPDAWVGKNMQIHGWVEPGSIDERIEGQQMKRDFILESKGARIHVTHVGAPPDTFKDAAEVVAQGRLVRLESGEYVLEADELMAKCPSKYEENQRTKNIAGPR